LIESGGFKSLDKWQLVKSIGQVNLQGDPPKVTFASCPKNPPRGVLGGGQVTVMAKKKVKIDYLFIVLNFSVKMMFLNHFGMFSTTRGHTETGQCYCVVGEFSATICRQYLR